MSYIYLYLLSIYLSLYRWHSPKPSLIIWNCVGQVQFLKELSITVTCKCEGTNDLRTSGSMHALLFQKFERARYVRTKEDGTKKRKWCHKCGM